MVNLKRTAEMARENLRSVNQILDAILGPQVSKEGVEEDKVAGHIGELNEDLEILLGSSSIILDKVNRLREMISIQDCKEEPCARR